MVGPRIPMGEGALVTPHPFFCVDAFELPSPARGAIHIGIIRIFLIRSIN
jgi:hypothetical protein